MAAFVKAHIHKTTQLQEDLKQQQSQKALRSFPPSESFITTRGQMVQDPQPQRLPASCNCVQGVTPA